MKPRSGSRAAKLEEDLQAAAAALISVLRRIEPERWSHVPDPSVWSVGKDAAHVAEAAVYHQWIVRLTIGQRVSSRRPPIERQELTTTMSAQEAVDLIGRRTEEGAVLISSLSDEQLTLPTRPPRARGQVLADTIDLVLIGHYEVHRRDIERKLRIGPDMTGSVAVVGHSVTMDDPLPPEAFLAPYPSDIREPAERLRAIVRHAVPNAVERVRSGWRIIGYDIAVGRRSVYFAFVAPEPLHVHIGFAHGLFMADPERRLEGAHLKLRKVRFLTFLPGQPIPEQALIDFTIEAARIAMMSREERLALVLDRESAPTGSRSG